MVYHNIVLNFPETLEIVEKYEVPQITSLAELTAAKPEIHAHWSTYYKGSKILKKNNGNALLNGGRALNNDNESAVLFQHLRRTPWHGMSVANAKTKHVPVSSNILDAKVYNMKGFYQISS